VRLTSIPKLAGRVLRTAAFSLLIACGGSDGPDGSAGASGEGGTSGGGGTSGDASGDPTAEIGVFSVQLQAPTSSAPDGSTGVTGSVGDKPVTASKIWELQAESGDCRLLVPRIAFCEPSCRSGEVCVEDGTCTPERMSIDVGLVSVSGVMTRDGATTFDLTRAGSTYVNGKVKLPYPAFAEGDAITLTAAGAGTTPGFTVASTGIAVLSIPSDAEYVVDGMDIAVQWEPPADASTSRILVKLDISHHGGEKGKIECDTEDDGEVVLPTDLVSQLIALGVAGFPSIVITRAADGTAQLPSGRVRLRVYQYVERFVDIPGVVSCESEAQCESGQTCLDNKTCG
jgi:hypothetical protein